MKKNKLDIRKLLKGTEYEAKAEMMAARIEARGWDNDHDIWSLPEGGAKFFGESAYGVLQTIIKQAEKPAAPEPEPENEPELESVIPEATASAVALAEEHEIDLSTVEGTGKHGAIIKADVEKLIA